MVEPAACCRAGHIPMEQAMSSEKKAVPSPSSSPSRRRFIKQAAAASITSFIPDALRHTAWAAGSDAPELKEVKVGFIPLTDCSSVVMASVLEIDKK